jgi:hypothetical protein
MIKLIDYPEITRKGRCGGIYNGDLVQIPLNPPFPKGDFIVLNCLQISCKMPKMNNDKKQKYM